MYLSRGNGRNDFVEGYPTVAEALGEYLDGLLSKHEVFEVNPQTSVSVLRGSYDSGVLYAVLPPDQGRNCTIASLNGVDEWYRDEDNVPVSIGPWEE